MKRCLLVWLMWMFAFQGLRADDALSVEIALPQRQGLGETSVEDVPRVLYRFATIPVVLRNISKEPLRIVNAEGSEGYENLSFRIEMEGGRSFPVRRVHRLAWERNLLYYWLLQPGEAFVLNIDLNDRSWDWNEGKDALRSRPGLLVPIYEKKEKSGPIWTGRVEGKSVRVAN